MELQDHAATAATITVALIGRDVLKGLGEEEKRRCKARSRTAGVMKTLMRTVETVDRKTRDGPREERARAFVWDRSADHIRASGHTAALKGRIHDRTRTLR